MNLKILAGLFAAVSVALAPAAMAQGKGAFAGKILIGDLSQQSGPGFQALTESTSRAVEVTVREINAAGGVKIKGKAYELAYKAIDTRSEPAATLAAAKEIIADGAVAVVLPSFASEVAYRALADAKIISFGAAPRVTNPLLIDGPQKHPYLFGTVELATPVITGWMAGIKQQYPNVKRIAVLNLTDPGGKFMDAAVQSAAKKYGLEYVGAEFVDITTTDFSAPLTSIKAKKPDLIYMGTGPQILSSTRQAVQLKAAPILWNYTMRPVDLKQIGPLGESTVVLADFRAPFTEGLTPPEFQKAATKFGALKSGEPVQVGIAASYYDFLHLLVRAMEKAGTMDDAAAISKALEGSSYEGPFGPSQVLANHTLRGPFGLITAKAGSLSLNVYKDVESASVKPVSTFTVKNTWSQ
jgi:ABC-type branched-subunit amino acid transport system substrate-binding protein